MIIRFQILITQIIDSSVSIALLLCIEAEIHVFTTKLRTCYLGIKMKLCVNYKEWSQIILTWKPYKVFKYQGLRPLSTTQNH